MPNIKSAAKRHKQSEIRRLRNRTQLVATRNLIKKLLKISTKTEAEQLYPTVVSRLDRLAQKRIIHKNTAANQKSRLALFVNRLSA
jgi:small subunit ribosomal protein S20